MGSNIDQISKRIKTYAHLDTDFYVSTCFIFVFACPYDQELGMVTMTFCTVWSKTIVSRSAIVISTT